MALAIRLSRTGVNGAATIPGGANNYILEAETIQITGEGAPLQTPQPRQNPLLLDLGYWKESITISGKASVAGTDRTEGGVIIADMDDIQAFRDPTATTPWDRETITLHDETVATHTSDIDYRVRIAKVTLEKQDVRNFWTFSISLLGFRTPSV